MIPINYLNAYVYGTIAALVAVAGGAIYFYNGMGAASYESFNGAQPVTLYLNKNVYDWNLKGLIYCLSFMGALILFLIVILVPTSDQVQRRMAANPFTQPMGGANPPSMQAPGAGQSPLAMQQQTPPQQQDLGESMDLGFEMEPEFDDFEEENDGMMSMETDDDDVIYGTGRITNKSHVNFVMENPDSALKVVLRKELDGRPLKPEQSKVYETWHDRGLSRTKLRKQLCSILECEELPKIAIHELHSKLKDKIYDMKNES